MTEVSYIPIEFHDGSYVPAEIIQYTIGTKFRWADIYKDDTYRIAIVTKMGFLQVKSVTDGQVDLDTTASLLPGSRYPLKKALFADELSWRASLPSGESHGEITVSLYKPFERCFIPTICAEMSDPQKLHALEKRYGSRNVVEHLMSPLAMLDQASCSLIYYLSKGSDDVWPVKRDLDYWTNYCATHTEENSRERIKIHKNGNTQFYLNVGDEFRTVAYDSYKGEDYIVDNTGMRYKSFAEMSSGTPSLSVTYQNMMIPLSQHFE